MKLNGLAIFVLLSIQSAFPDYIIHLEHPWNTYMLHDSLFTASTQFHFLSYLPTPQNNYANMLGYYNGADLFGASDFPEGVKEIWIVPNGAAKATT